MSQRSEKSQAARNWAILASAGLLSLTAVSCTGQLPNSFRYKQQKQSFDSQLKINTTIDLLWVVDNSASMDVSQEKLRKGLQGFASTYLKPYWDIRIAVITTDTYLANPAFSSYLSRTIPNTTGTSSTYINSRLASFVPHRSGLIDLVTGIFTSGLVYNDLVPSWGPNYAKLEAGIHDGPITAFCMERLPYFMKGVTQCQIRDAAGYATGVEKCVNPGSGEESVSQCVNTTQNNTVRTGKAIISTKPAAGIESDEAWTSQLVKDFMVNATTGSAGHGSERGIGSFLQLLDDNESAETAFFRRDSLRGIIFVSDEEDQTMALPSTPPASFAPETYYKCDQASLLTLNAAGTITGNNGFCCTDPAKNCRYGSEGISCASKTVDGLTYTPSVCPRDDLLLPVSSAKSTIDTFFRNLDQSNEEDSPNYFVVSIVPLTAATITTLQSARNSTDTLVGAIKNWAVDRGDRYLELGNQVGNGSLSMDIGAENYAEVLDQIGRTIVQKKSTFPLDREPTGSEDMIVTVVHADGSETEVTSDQYVINGKNIVFSNQEFVLSLKDTDSIAISYQPRKAY